MLTNVNLSSESLGIPPLENMTEGFPAGVIPRIAAGVWTENPVKGYQLHDAIGVSDRL